MKPKLPEEQVRLLVLALLGFAACTCPEPVATVPSPPPQYTTVCFYSGEKDTPPLPPYTLRNPEQGPWTHKRSQHGPVSYRLAVNYKSIIEDLNSDASCEIMTPEEAEADHARFLREAHDSGPREEMVGPQIWR